MEATQARSTVLDVLAKIAPEVDPGTIDPDADLAEECDLDSMDFLTLVEGVSNAIGRDIPERDYPAISTLNGFGDYLASTSSDVTSS